MYYTSVLQKKTCKHTVTFGVFLLYLKIDDIYVHISYPFPVGVLTKSFILHISQGPRAMVTISYQVVRLLICLVLYI